MKRLVILTLLALLFTSTYAQVSVDGQVRSKQTNEPLAFATVYILNAKDSALTMALTDDKGFFTVSVKPGVYKFVFRFLGYKQDTVMVEAFSDKSLGIVYLELQSQQIQQVTVKASTRQNDLDRQVVLVTKQMRERSANVNEVLEQISGINYDRYNNQISVDGQTNVLILVNGLKKNQQYIEALNPERILKVEIIRDPGGRYGLEGYAAVINIILKDNFRGYELLTNGSSIIAPNSSYQKLISGMLGANLTLTQKKFNFYTNFNYSNLVFPLDMTVHRSYIDGQQTYRLPNGVYPSMAYKANLLNLTSGLDYKINPLNILSFEFNMQQMPDHSHTYQRFLFREIDSLPDNSVNEFYQFTEQINPRADYNGSVFYKGKPGVNVDVQADATYGVTKSMNQSMVRILNSIDNLDFNDITLRNGDVLNNELTKYLRSNVEASFNAGKKLNFTTGLGINQRNIKNSTQLYGSDNLVNATFVDRYARGYLYMKWKPSSKLNLKIGAAYQQYFMDNGNFQKTMGIVEPYADIKWQPLGLFGMTLKLRSKADYPTATQLNPELRVTDYRVAYQGNPNLTPDTWDRFSLRMDVLGGMLSVEPYYEYTKNYIAQVLEKSDNPNIDALITYKNIGHFTNYGTKFNFMLPLSKNLIVKSDADIYWYSLEYLGKERSIQDWRGSAQLLYYNQKLFSLGLMYQNMNSKILTAQGYRTSSNDFTGLFIQKQLFNKRLNLMLFYIFPLNSKPGWLDYDSKTYTQGPLFTETSIVNQEILKNLLVFNISFRLSKGKAIKVDKQIERENLQVKSLF